MFSTAPKIMPRDDESVTAVAETVDGNEAVSESDVSDDGEDVDMVVRRDASGNEYILDDFPCSGPAFMDLADDERAVVTWAITNRSVAVKDLTYYVYCKSIAAWSQMQSATAAQELAAVTGTTAPVNYKIALERYYSLITRVAVQLRELERSVCIGTWRMTFTVEHTEHGPIVIYKPHKTVIDNTRGPEHRRIYMFVTQPIVMPLPFECPTKTVVDLDGDIINKILLPLRDDQKLDFMWRMGKAFSDGEAPSVIVLYGKTGHEGKSVLATNVSRILTTGVVWTIADLIGKKASWPKSDEVMRLADKRIIVCDECEIEEDFNYNNIKRWTSGAPIQSDGLSAYLSQTIIAISNKMCWSKKEAINNSIGRRVVIYKMDKPLGKLKPFPKHSITNKIRMQFIALGLSVADAFDYPPTSLEIAIYSIFRKSSNWITAGMQFDDGASLEQCATATRVMSHRAGVPTERLVSCIGAISKALVYQPRYLTGFVLGVRCMSFKTTPAGDDYIEHNFSSETILFDDLKEVLRAF
jgi:hypothetical protein